MTVCKSCGIALFRQFQNATLLKGWWGPISVFINFFCMCGNVGAWLQLSSLKPPTLATDHVAVPLNGPMPHGAPLLRRAGIWVTAALFIYIAFSFAHMKPTQATAPGVHVPDATSVRSIPVVGDCMTAKGAKITGIVSCDQPHWAKIVAFESSRELCPNIADYTAQEVAHDLQPARIICLDTSG